MIERATDIDVRRVQRQGSEHGRFAPSCVARVRLLAPVLEKLFSPGFDLRASLKVPSSAGAARSAAGSSGARQVASPPAASAPPPAAGNLNAVMLSPLWRLERRRAAASRDGAAEWQTVVSDQRPAPHQRDRRLAV